jgi:hypothetical protein
MLSTILAFAQGAAAAAPTAAEGAHKSEFDLAMPDLTSASTEASTATICCWEAF